MGFESSEFDVARLSSAFEDASLTPQLWMPALRQLAEACCAEHGQLIGLNGPGTVMFNWISDDSEKLAEVVEDDIVHNPRTNYRMIAGMSARELQVVGEDEYERVMPRLPSLEYVRFAEKFGIQNGVQTNLSTGDGQLIGLATLRPDRTTEQQRQVFAQCVPAARTAVRVQAALDHQGTMLLAGTLEAMNSAAFILDGSGTVQAFTPLAEDVLAEDRLLSLREKTLKAAHPAQDRELQQSIAAALADPASSSHRSLALASPSGTPVVLDVVTIARRDYAMQFRPRLVITVRRSGEDANAADLIQRAFGFTATEAEIAIELAGGEARSKIAERRGISEHTVRSHVKSIFGKSGVQREPELVARLGTFLRRG